MAARHLPQTLEAVRLVIKDHVPAKEAAARCHISYSNLKAQLAKFRTEAGRKKFRGLIKKT